MKSKLLKSITSAVIALALIVANIPAGIGSGGVFDRFAPTASAESEQEKYSYMNASWDNLLQKVSYTEEYLDASNFSPIFSIPGTSIVVDEILAYTDESDNTWFYVR